ncbi:MAG TPA: ATP-binding cassette domain-containing protein [Vicinamibacterales bacterium]|nr:ATP-binding cassette domain-containing protein [Vicinamibacterales bacterium]
MTILDIHDVTKDYRGLRPLRLQQLTVADGESVALLGFDRITAEVLVNLVTGASLPDSGDVRLFGRSTAAIGDSAEWLSIVDRVGIVSDRAVLLEEMTVIQNLAMPFTLDIEPPPEDVRRRAESLAREVGIADAAWAQPVAATGADVHIRVRLARAIALDPQLLLFEHASASLSAADANAFARHVRALTEWRGVALIAISADRAFARAVAPRVVTLDAATGRLR